MSPILSAARTITMPLPKPRSLAARDGLRYERKIAKRLGQFLLDGHLTVVEHNPWFSYKTATSSANCVPDFVLLHTTKIGRPILLVAEVKLTWVPTAQVKLSDVYCPTATIVFRRPAAGFVICRNLTLETPRTAIVVHSLSDAIAAAEPPPSAEVILHWPETGLLPW